MFKENDGVYYLSRLSKENRREIYTFYLRNVGDWLVSDYGKGANIYYKGQTGIVKLPVQQIQGGIFKKENRK